MTKAPKLKASSSKAGVEKHDVTGFESVVPQIRQIDTDIAELNKKRNGMKDLILSRVKELKKELEAKKQLFKSFVVLSEDNAPAVVLFKNAFKKLDVSNEEDMRKVLNGKFDQLFEFVESVKLKSNADMDELRKLLGARFDDFFQTNKHIAFREDFMEQRTELRKKMGKRQNAIVDKWVADNQASPDLRMKG